MTEQGRGPSTMSNLDRGNVDEILANPEQYSPALVHLARWLEGPGRAEVDAAYAEERKRRAALSAAAESEAGE